MSRRAAAQGILEPARGPLARHVLLAIGLAVLAPLLLYRATVAEMIAVWSSSNTYDYAWVVAPTVVLLLWWRRRALAEAVPGGSLLGVLGAAAAALLWLAAELLDVAEARHFALVAGLLAVALAGLGARPFVRLLPCLLVLFFLVPSGEFLLQPLREIAVAELRVFAWLAGLAFEREGFAVFIEQERYVVIDDCAGLPYLLTGAFLGAVFGNLNYRSLWKVGVVTTTGALAGVLANGLRISAIAAYDAYTGVQMSVSEHSVFELPALIFLFVSLLLLHARLKPERNAARALPRPEGDAARSASTRALALSLAAALLLAVAPLLAPSRPDAEAGPVALAAADLPQELAGWRRTAADASSWNLPVPEAEGAATARYRAAGGRAAEILHLRAASDQAFGALDLAGASPPALSWLPTSRHERRLCDGALCVPAVEVRYVLKDSPRSRRVLWTYAQQRSATVSPLELRGRSAWRRLAGGRGDVRLLAVMTEGEGAASGRLSDAEAGALLLALLELPDGADARGAGR